MKVTIDGVDYLAHPSREGRPPDLVLRGEAFWLSPGIAVPDKLFSFPEAINEARKRNLRLCSIDELQGLFRDGQIERRGWSWTSTPARGSRNIWTVCLESGSVTLRSPESNWGLCVFVPERFR